MDIDSSDMVGIQMTGEQGIINIYNNCTHDQALEAVDGYMRREGRQQAQGTTVRHLWMGDFNRHSPVWDEERNNHLFTSANLEAAARLMDLTARYNITMILPPGTPTLKAMATGNETRVDNVFCDSNSVNLIDICDTRPEWRPVKTDHYPIICRIQMGAATNQFQPRRNFRETDWAEFAKTLVLKLSQLPIPCEITE
jgi:hypothetical protein